MRAASKRTTTKGQPTRNADPVYKGDVNSVEKRGEQEIKLRKRRRKGEKEERKFVKNHHIAR